MRKCLKIRVSGDVQNSSYRSFTQKNAQALGIEGTIQNGDDSGVLIIACGQSDKLDKFIDMLYKGTAESSIEDLIAEPFVNEKDFRGAFRIIGD